MTLLENVYTNEKTTSSKNNTTLSSGRYQRQNLGESSSPLKSEDPQYIMQLHWDKEHITNGGLPWNLFMEKEQRYTEGRSTKNHESNRLMDHIIRGNKFRQRSRRHQNPSQGFSLQQSGGGNAQHPLQIKDRKNSYRYSQTALYYSID